ncbi:hypothetical protein WISP_26615 [Willisornis vidua]|uniref:EMI domain-containing protein n=1 Tax=Willisornis vidua TaxID=1566151 RepID=A0ABQ9DQZ3_9PASS|nr:hypothetical protein WISP_26615 [Willisornis vidua]
MLLRAAVLAVHATLLAALRPSDPNVCSYWERVVYRTEYRQAVRTDYRRRYQCCQGYYESRDSCVQCDEQSWGPGCRQSCNCHHGAPCDPLTGVCSCPPGFVDPLCHQPCPPGTYGQGCHLPCPCHHQAPCNASTGACLCPPGLTGPL